MVNLTLSLLPLCIITPLHFMRGGHHDAIVRNKVLAKVDEWRENSRFAVAPSNCR